MYLGGSIMTFALPYGAFIVIATALYFLFRARHSSPRLKYLTPGPVTSVLTREPGPVPAPAPKAAEASAEAGAAEAAGDGEGAGDGAGAEDGPAGPATEGRE